MDLSSVPKMMIAEAEDKFKDVLTVKKGNKSTQLKIKDLTRYLAVKVWQGKFDDPAKRENQNFTPANLDELFVSYWKTEDRAFLVSMKGKKKSAKTTIFAELLDY